MGVLTCDTTLFYVKASTAGTCVLCSALSLPASMTLDKSHITGCTVNGAGDTVASITSCADNYTPLTLSDGTIKGCLSCKGIDNGDTANVAADTTIKSCTAPSVSAMTKAKLNPKTITNI